MDRRIGEGDVDMTPEEKAVQRFAREKEKKAKGRSMFDLEGSDDEGAGGFGLTHGGKKIDDLAADDFGEEVSGGSDEEEDDDGELLRLKRRRSDVDEEDDEEMEGDDPADDQPERKKTKKEVMEEVIAKSKMHKYERQKVKEDDDDLREKLDQDIGELMGLLQGVKKPPPPPKAEETAATNGDGPVMNPERQKLLAGGDKDYDKYMKQLTNEARAAPSNKSLTAEEKAQKEAERLKELEEKRQKRMRGENVSDDEKDAAPGADVDIREDDEDEMPDEAADFGFTSSVAQPKKAKEEQLVLDDEDEFALDEDLVASGSEAEMSDDESGEGSEDDSDADGEPHEDEEDEFVTEILGSNGATGSNATKVGERTATTTSGVAFTYPCPRSHDELLGIVKDLPAEQLPTVIQRIRALYHPSLSASHKESMADFACALVDHLAYMADEKQSMAVIEQVIRHLHSLSRTYPTQIGEQFRLNLASFQGRTHPSAGDMVVLTAIGSIYPTSDHWHQVVTPAVTLMARWLGLNAPLSNKPIEEQTLATGAFMVTLCIRYQTLSKRYVPEALRFTIRVLSSKDATKATHAPYLTNLTAMADLWKEKPSFIELFTPTLPLLKSLSAKKEQQTITILLHQSRLRRRPLELHHHRKQPIRTSVPKFEENFNPDKHYDPDKERSDANKLQKEYKRERKGAMRELRKDANFIAREQLKEKRTKDEEYEKKHRRLIAEIQSEEGKGGNDYAREKAMRQRKK